MRLGRRLALGACVLAVVACPARSAEAVLLDAEPAGSYLSIQGAVSLSGNAPLSMAGFPAGEYRLSADGPGLAAARGRFVLTESGVRHRAWAGVGAFLLPPGIAHLERGESRGWALLGAGTISATMSLVTQASLERARNELRAAAPGSLELAAATEKRNDLEEVRSLWLGHLAVSWIGAGLEAVLFTPQPSFSSPDAGRTLVTLPRAGGAQAAARSVFMPGSGQRYLGHTGRANAFFTATSGLAAASIAAHDRYLQSRRAETGAQRRLDAAQDEAERSLARRALKDARNRTDNRNVVRWICAGAAAGAYLWNVLDALSLGESAKVAGLAWSAAPAPGGLLVCATWSMP
jgi:hypothetical protein